MIGEFITRSLLLVFGYGYPAFQCFKTVEKNRVDIQELRFWCQYWIIVAVITILEKVGDVFISWLPMYGELKLALFIYLWHPKTMGTGYIYEALLQPYVSRHETDIDRSLIEFRERAWKLAIYYWQNCTELGSTKILQFFQFAASQSAKITNRSTSTKSREIQLPDGAPPPAKSSGFFFRRNKPDKRRPPPPVTPSAPPLNLYRNETPKSESIQVQLQNQTQYIRPEDVLIPDSDPDAGSGRKTGLDHDVQAARLRLRRFIDND
ncbi:putative HVA22-like protein g [Andrographis paniculata]|uniref:putative HVA22-like protein g n=1 Tax=Andrographis paniculata TaxID=175694 RepID=UPI0021E727F4|nr:putative HVA22-like protein g [Andrographis paniculata]XP_051131403.1 putative HVA22-like protein g [Andrographis paniculata]XP_051131404.1 putative HVA22-like protein g [Andrographis paniculata]